MDQTHIPNALKAHFVKLENLRPRSRKDQACVQCNRGHRKCEVEGSNVSCSQCIRSKKHCSFNESASQVSATSQGGLGMSSNRHTEEPQGYVPAQPMFESQPRISSSNHSTYSRIPSAQVDYTHYNSYIPSRGAAFLNAAGQSQYDGASAQATMQSTSAIHSSHYYSNNPIPNNYATCYNRAEAIPTDSSQSWLPSTSTQSYDSSISPASYEDFRDEITSSSHDVGYDLSPNNSFVSYAHNSRTSQHMYSNSSYYPDASPQY